MGEFGLQLQRNELLRGLYQPGAGPASVGTITVTDSLAVGGSVFFGFSMTGQPSFGFTNFCGPQGLPCAAFGDPTGFVSGSFGNAGIAPGAHPYGFETVGLTFTNYQLTAATIIYDDSVTDVTLNSRGGTFTETYTMDLCDSCTFSGTVLQVPEPASAKLLAAGLLGMVGVALRRRGARATLLA